LTTLSYSIVIEPNPGDDIPLHCLFILQHWRKLPHKSGEAHMASAECEPIMQVWWWSPCCVKGQSI